MAAPHQDHNQCTVSIWQDVATTCLHVAAQSSAASSGLCVCPSAMVCCSGMCCASHGCSVPRACTRLRVNTAMCNSTASVNRYNLLHRICTFCSWCYMRAQVRPRTYVSETSSALIVEHCRWTNEIMAGNRQATLGSTCRAGRDPACNTRSCVHLSNTTRSCPDHLMLRATNAAAA